MPLELRSGTSVWASSLRWILTFPEVTAAIPGAKTPIQIGENVAAASLPPLDAATMAHISAVYDRHIRGQIHDRW